MEALSADPHLLAREEFKQKLRQRWEAKLEQMAQLLIDCPDEQFFGQTEFALRDLAHEMAREATEQALTKRKKTIRRRPASAVRTVSCRWPPKEIDRSGSTGCLEC